MKAKTLHIGEPVWRDLPRTGWKVEGQVYFPVEHPLCKGKATRHGVELQYIVAYR